LLFAALVVVFIKLCNGNRRYAHSDFRGMQMSVTYYVDSQCREAFNIVVLFWLFCGALLLYLTQTVVRDEAAVQQAVKDAFANAKEEAHNKRFKGDSSEHHLLSLGAASVRTEGPL
jgi:hypothetical protein